MSMENVEDGIVRFETNFAKIDNGMTSFDTDKIRQYLRSKPSIVGELALLFVHSCCGQLGDNEQEQNSCWFQALDELEESLLRIKR